MVWVFLSAITVLYFANIRFPVKEKSFRDNKTPLILCTGKGIKKFNYSNINDCRSAFNEFGPNSICEQGCIGLKSCVCSCPKGAIGEDLKINYELCDGCGICVDTCPQGLIKMTENNQKLYRACLTKLDPEQADENCAKSCIKCYLCLDICTRSAIYIDERGIPRIDFKKCDSCLDCLKKCPTGVIMRKYD